MDAYGRIAISAAAALLLASVGCQGPGQTTDGSGRSPTAPGEEVVAQPYPPIPDVPIPVGFDLDEDRSWSSGSGSARYADHLYKGRSGKYAVARFFLRQMRQQNWEKKNEMFLQGRILLDFEKGAENCRVMVTDGGLFDPTHIHVTLWTGGTSRGGSMVAPGGG